MIYLNELNNRVFFFFFTFSISAFFIYLYRQDFFFLLSLPTLNQTFTIDYFIFTTPQEIFSFTILTVVLFLFFFLFPYMVWAFFDYCRAGLHSSEYKKAKTIGLAIFISFFFFNCILFLLVYPLFWNFFYIFSADNKESILKFFFELRALTYFDFILSLSLIMNAFFIISSLLLLLGKNYSKYKVIKKKRYFLLFFILISTLLTPPVLEMQIILFTFLYVCIELFYFFIFLIKIYKGSQLNTISIDETKTT